MTLHGSAPPRSRHRADVPQVSSGTAWQLAGVLAGCMSTLVFTCVHQLTISDIWFMIVPMLIAGAVSGLCIAWSFQRVFVSQSVRAWLAYNGALLLMFGVLAVASILILEPVTTMAELTATSGPVDHLIVPALPVTVLVTVLTTVVIGRTVARRWTDYLRILLTAAVLMVLVGLNISVLGLVDFAGATLAPVVKFLGLVVLLDGVYAVTFEGLRRWRVSWRPHGSHGNASIAAPLTGRLGATHEESNCQFLDSGGSSGPRVVGEGRRQRIIARGT